MAEVTNIIAATTDFASYYKGGGLQYKLTAAVTDRSGTAINLSAWDSITAAAPSQNGNVDNIIDVTAAGNADGTILLTMNENDYTFLTTGGAIVVEGVHASGDDAQLLARLSLAIS